MMTKAPQKPAEGWPPLSIRFDHDIRAAMEKAAKDDRRPVSQLVQKVMADWLKERKYLK
jgi:hypothetical protein